MSHGQVCFFVSDVKCGAWRPMARFRSKSGKFQPAELVTVRLRFVTARFWVKGPSSQSSGFPRPAEDLVGLRPVSPPSLFHWQVGCLSLKFRSFSVESRSLCSRFRFARKTGEFHPAKLVTVCHRLVTALWGRKMRKSPVPERMSFLASLNQ